jgi:hypothetical protein
MSIRMYRYARVGFITVFLNSSRSSSSRINSLFLLHSLMLSKSQPNALCHFDVSTSAIFHDFNHLNR